MDKPRVCIVGNAIDPVARGPWIDQHDYVVRFNDYVLAKHEDRVGAKLTHWAIVTGHFARGRNLSRTLGGRLYCGHLESVWLRIDIHEPPAWYLGAIQNLRHVREYDNLTIVRNDLQECPHMPQDWMTPLVVDPAVPVSLPSTGLLAIANALLRWGPPLDVCGFGPRDGFRDGHYYKPTARALSVHNWDAERALLNQLADAGVINWQAA